jgi:hypothetical protein
VGGVVLGSGIAERGFSGCRAPGSGCPYIARSWPSVSPSILIVFGFRMPPTSLLSAESAPPPPRSAGGLACAIWTGC